MLQEAAQKFPEKTAVTQVERGVHLSYADLSERVAAFSAGCAQLGLHSGDKIIACLPNWPEYLIALFAAARTGLVLVPVNPRLRHREIEFIVHNSGARAAIVADQLSESTVDSGIMSHYDIFRACQTANPSLLHIISVATSESATEPEFTFDAVIASGRTVAEDSPTQVHAGDVAAIVYTSGTTGVPKGAVLTHQNLLFSSDAMNTALESSERDVVLVVVPVCHVFGIAVCIMSIVTQSTIVLMERFEPDAVFQVVERERVTVHHGVSTMFVLELNHPKRARYDLSSLRTGIVAATPCPYEIVQRIRSEIGLEPILSYGMTETSPALTASHFEQEAWVYATVGQALPGVSLRVVDELGRPLPHGQVGELVCKTPGLMRGYYQNEEATRKAIDVDGWFHTGDLATIDNAKYVTIVGRIKEMINRGGFKIYPREVEEVIYRHPAVQEAAVVGVPDPVLGERACACITITVKTRVSPEDIRAYCRQYLADYKVPDFVEVMEEFPLNSSGKIYKLELAKWMKQRHPPVYQPESR